MSSDYKQWAPQMELNHLRTEAATLQKDEATLIREKCVKILKNSQLSAHARMHLLTCTSTATPGIISAIYTLPQKGCNYKLNWVHHYVVIVYGYLVIQVLQVLYLVIQIVQVGDSRVVATVPAIDCDYDKKKIFTWSNYFINISRLSKQELKNF